MLHCQSFTTYDPRLILITYVFNMKMIQLESLNKKSFEIIQLSKVGDSKYGESSRK